MRARSPLTARRRSKAKSRSPPISRTCQRGVDISADQKGDTDFDMNVGYPYLWDVGCQVRHGRPFSRLYRLRLCTRRFARRSRSAGGEVAGPFDLVDDIYRMRPEKPIWAVLSEMAASAAYAIASATSRITIPRTGVAGSIGVIAIHVDFSRALDAAGITPTVVKFGDRKDDGIETSPLTKEARRRFQADIDKLGDLFVATVARNRGRSSAFIRSQQAATYLGADAISAGLADTVMSSSEAFAALAAKVRQDSRSGVSSRRSVR
jgi:hypothetical protein